MGRIFTSVTQMMGGTPLLQLCNVQKTEHLQARILVKLERSNPGGSAKDRVALAMVEDAEGRGLLQPGGTIIEPTSGNTGIGLACVGTSREYRVILVMPDSMSVERRSLIAAFGAECVLTPGALGMQGAIQRAQQLQQEIPGSWIAGQFDNPVNPQAHYTTTGPEIWADTDGNVDIFVAGVGTGGTVTGVGRYLKEKNPEIQVVAVEPAASPLLSGGEAHAHGLQGMGANFIPEILDRKVYDRVMPVTEEEAYAAARKLGRTEGVLVGISSGAALHAALMLAKAPANKGKTIVALMPDSGERYLSTALFRDESL